MIPVTQEFRIGFQNSNYAIRTGCPSVSTLPSAVRADVPLLSPNGASALGDVSRRFKPHGKEEHLGTLIP